MRAGEYLSRRDFEKLSKHPGDSVLPLVWIGIGLAAVLVWALVELSLWSNAHMDRAPVIQDDVLANPAGVKVVPR